MNLSKSQLIILGVVALVVIIFAVVVITGIGLRTGGEKASLTVWGIDSESAFAPAISGFTKEHRGVEIEYKQIQEARYEKDLIDALAAGTGPDIFMLRSDWLSKHGNKIVPAPENSLSIGSFNNNFPQVASQDFTSGNTVYASPLYIDTLALYYNRDIFDKEGIALPPNTWDNFKTAVSRGVTASFGGYSPLVTRATDIINALFMQAGADLSLQNKSFVRFSGSEGVRALDLYTDINPPSVDSYSGFADESVGMIIDYQSAKPILLGRNPFLNFGIAPLPQFNPGAPVVPARYYGLAVSNKSSSESIAWDFVSYATSNLSAAEGYLLATGRPPALRSLIQEYINTPALGVFASQALIARSWNMPPVEEVSEVFNTMIQSVLSGENNIREALTQAELSINNIIR